ncbi:hypothetical protein UFOVP347_18 [uncultured Caudovirales phage]|uniref:Uncharacterized protein n=1 Tax=uncultured Caudovirales phage TaxID=2100421 RepID=A0A6J5LXY6_9CAUD|nr:hypothetical protein UFOVP347_18 [uncultured Caudovirales phage]
MPNERPRNRLTPVHPMAPEGQTIHAIIWIDAVASSGWSTDPTETSVMTVMSVGRIVHEDDKQIVMAGTFGLGEDADTNCRIAIPKGWVKSQVQLVARA